MEGIDLSGYACRNISVSFAVINGNAVSRFSNETSFYINTGDFDIEEAPYIIPTKTISISAS